MEKYLGVPLSAEHESPAEADHHNELGRSVREAGQDDATGGW